MTKSALIVVDVQNDFISGTLSLSNCPSKHDGAEIVPIINKLVQKSSTTTTTTGFDLIAYTQDWHPHDHISFVDNAHLRTFHHDCPRKPDDVKVFEDVSFHINGCSEPRCQVLWPRHCVQESHGAELHPDLIVPPSAVVIKKGADPDVDSYSAFWDNSKLRATELETVLREAEVTRVYVCGIATDVCVKATVIDALELGFETFLIENACRGVDENAIHKALDEIREKGGKIISADDVMSF